MSTITKKRIKPKHPYIEKRPGVCGGEPVISGTRVSVGLVVEMERAGHSADEMVTLYPHITHAQIYDALSYMTIRKKLKK